MKWEMQRALSCTKAMEKKRLVKEWKKKYDELFFNELLRCARNKDVCVEIANWDVEGMR